MDAHIVEVGCIGPCYLEPLMDVALPGQPRVSYANVTPAKARKILTASLVEGDLLPKQAKGHFGDAAFTAANGHPALLRPAHAQAAGAHHPEELRLDRPGEISTSPGRRRLPRF